MLVGLLALLSVLFTLLGLSSAYLHGRNLGHVHSFPNLFPYISELGGGFPEWMGFGFCLALYCAMCYFRAAEVKAEYVQVGGWAIALFKYDYSGFRFKRPYG